MAVELQQALEVTIGISVPTIELLSASVDNLVRRTLEQLLDPPRTASVCPPTAAVLPTGTSDLRAAFLERICVQPPYFDLEDMTVDGDFVEAAVRTAIPSDREDHAVSLLDAARHLAVLGSCAASRRCPIPGKVYYPLVKMHMSELREPRPLPARHRVEPVDRVRFRARCTEFDLRSSRATATAELLDREGGLIVAVGVEYHVIPEEQFVSLFRDRAKPTHEHSGANPYASWRALPRPEHEDSRVRVDLGKVSSDHCLGHFVGFPALPVSMMGRDAVQLIAEGIAHQNGWHRALLTLVRGSVDAFSFVFAHESATMTARRVGNGEAGHHEVWECRVNCSGRLAARFEFELFAREACASDTQPNNNRNESSLDGVTGRATPA